MALLDAPQRPRRRTGKIIATATIAVVVFALVAGFLTYAGNIATVGWRTYYDAAGLFSAQYPLSWMDNTSNYTQLQTYSPPYPSFVTTLELVEFQSPGEQQFMSADIAAALYTNDAVASKYYCSKLAHDAQDSGPFHSRDFSGISAVAISASSWEFDTTSAHFTISAFLTSNNTQSTNASLYRGVLDNILNSIQIENTKPLVC